MYSRQVGTRVEGEGMLTRRVREAAGRERETLERPGVPSGKVYVRFVTEIVGEVWFCGELLESMVEEDVESVMMGG